MISRIVLMAIVLGVGVIIGAYAANSDNKSNQSLSSLPESPFLSNHQDQSKSSTIAQTDINSLSSLIESVKQGMLERRLLEKQVNDLQQQVKNLQKALNKNTVLSSRESTTSSTLDAAHETKSDDADNSDDLENRFLAAGFTAEQAASLKKRVDDNELQQLYLRDQAVREGWMGSNRYFQSVQDLRKKLDGVRDDMGEDSYDKFLYATNRPNRVIAQSVMEGSPAQQAGLQTGDTIYRYDGKRVFSWNELRSATTQGQAGDLASVEVIRNGEHINYYVPRGPLGVKLDLTSEKP